MTEVHTMTLGQSVLFGWVVARAETWAAVCEPRRVLGVLLYGGTLGVAVTLMSLDAALGGDPWQVATTGMVAATGTFLAMIAMFLLALTLGEAVAGGRADHAWLIQTPRGSATATATHRPDGSWLLRSVAAWPRRRGLGSLVLQEILEEADTHRVTLTLTAATRTTATGFYGPAGFAITGRRWNGLPMRRTPECGRMPGARPTLEPPTRKATPHA